MTQIDHLKQAITEQIEKTADVDLLDFVFKLLIAQG